MRLLLKTNSDHKLCLSASAQARDEERFTTCETHGAQRVNCLFNVRHMSKGDTRINDANQPASTLITAACCCDGVKVDKVVM